MISFKSIKRVDLLKDNKVYSYFVFTLLNGSKRVLTPQQFEEMKASKYV
jgi:hypothetical protein|tara:strand:- start:1185 stop:1331 length:147 start_codon:yes stop_codon:yes gene_type:complete